VRVAVLGAGRVGVPTAAALARLGHQVVAADVNRARIDALVGGSVPFHEAGLLDLVREGVEGGRLRFTAEIPEALDEAEAAFLCVGTPPRRDGSVDLDALHAAVEDVARAGTRPQTLVIKSTVPVGTADRVESLLAGASGAGPFAVVANPEFLREGRAVEDSLRPFRIIVGANRPEGLAAMRDLYAPLIQEGVPWIETDPRTAEVTKHACNAFLATKVSFVNAVARVCEAGGADVVTVAHAMGIDGRIGPQYLQAGLGYGGYCLPKDVQAFERSAAELGYDFGLLREVERVNGEAVEAAHERVISAVGELRESRVALLGLSFKPGTDNVTESPALALARRLLDGGARVRGYDPHAGPAAEAALPDLEVAGDPYSALEAAECAVLCTEWPELLSLDPERMRGAMAKPVVVDGRNALDGEILAEAGFTYLPLGRPSRAP
jgi:UDPglucose 6-dehydrogenase